MNALYHTIEVHTSEEQVLMLETGTDQSSSLLRKPPLSAGRSKCSTSLLLYGKCALCSVSRGQRAGQDNRAQEHARKVRQHSVAGARSYRQTKAHTDLVRSDVRSIAAMFARVCNNGSGQRNSI